MKKVRTKKVFSVCLRDILLYGLFPFCVVSALSFLFVSCEELDNDIEKHGGGDEETALPVALDEVARLLSVLPVGRGQLGEVHDAVSSSSENGYDEEYTMRDLFRMPGAGVGDDRLPEGTKSAVEYETPMRDLIKAHLYSSPEVRSDGSVSSGYGGGMTPDEFIEALESSDIQIYWPNSENWDGKELPIITFDPLDGAETNLGYRMITDENGVRTVEEVIVDEQTAMKETVWVVNRNDDGDFTSLEMLRREDPDWGSGGGSIVVGKQLCRPLPLYGTAVSVAEKPAAASAESTIRTLILRDFTMLRNYDSWFAGASEFFVKMGSVEDFTASTEAELKLYNPSVTDFMIVVKRKYRGEPQPFNAVLVSEWTDQLESCAFMIAEDDGGTRTSWKCTALVRVESKSYGVELELPINTRDDIVWRGQLTSKYIMANNNVTGHFGDVNLTFEIVEY
ncbi:MAG: hypothetical protein IAC23_02140 [Bacteroidetes bacterium]|uniref:Uncharacterized protein n=1 Tax=Candidatus Cryptobacteroides merdavium TaxID=2840769 RepID=A0A9D9HCA7_9BACT|nr:hypothetical protein [Candidatus Cryptobacteroides merdavium]